MKRSFLTLLLACFCILAGAQEADGTYFFAQRDTCNLFMDVYNPSRQSERTFQGKAKPTILFVFGGGFIMGRRSDPYYLPWFRLLNQNGYRVITIDYRLGLKGLRMRFDLFHLIESAELTKKAVDIGVEDVFAAVRYIADNAETLEVDMDNIVIAGSSAGAMISLSSEWEVCNGSERTAILPEGFRFAGVMSFAGAIMSTSGVPAYATEPCPQLLIHGTADGAVAYNKLSFGKRGMFGSAFLTDNVLKKNGYVFHMYRFRDHTHDMAGHMMATWPLQKEFLEQDVILGNRMTVDATIDDPNVPKLESVDLSDIYK